MPLSASTNISCDVNKNGGNDLSFAGPFNTIQKAINYILANFGIGLSPSQHATIYIGPGTYSDPLDIISVTAMDGSRYIDFVGLGIDNTILQNTSSAFISINNPFAENRFSNMTIRYNGPSTLGNTAIEVPSGAAVFDHCNIISAQRCINNLSGGCVVKNCTIISTASNAEAIISSANGLLSNCVIKANTLDTFGGAISGMAGVMEYCDITLNTNVRTDGLVNAKGRVSHCNFIIGGEVDQATPDTIYDHVWVRSTCISSPIIDHINGYIDHCYFENLSASEPSVHFMDLGTGQITNSTFLQVNNSAVIIAVIASGNKIFNSTFMNNGLGNYCLQAQAVGTLIQTAGIISNIPIDPGFTNTEMGLTGTTIGLTKGYSQKRWWALSCHTTTIESVGGAAVSVGALSIGNDINGPAVTDTTSTTLNNAARINHASYDTVRRQHTPTLYVKFKLGKVIGVRFWCGLFATNPSVTSDLLSPTIPGAGIRFSFQPGLDTAFQFVTCSGGAQTSLLSSVVPGVNVVHTFKMTLDDLNNRVLFQLDNTPVVAILAPLPLPSPSQDLGFAIQATNTLGGAGSAVPFTLYDTWCEYNA